MDNQEALDKDRLPLGFTSFSNIRHSQMIYIDKTALIEKIAKQRSPIFFSRPRRFGKSLLVNTLHSLFANGLQDFSGLDIENKWHDHLYKVIHLDFSSVANRNTEFFIKSLRKKLIRSFKIDDDEKLFKKYQDDYPSDLLDDLAQNADDNSMVLLIDEYDAPLTHRLDNLKELKDIQSILSDFYAVVKQYTDKFRLIFITGVTRFSHVSIFSAFNNLVDLSLKTEFNELLGFTQNDLELFFDQYIEEASHTLKIDKNDTHKRIEQYYDGFQFSFDATETVYNPWSILYFLRFPEDGFKNYWFESGGVTSLLMNYMKINKNFNFINYKNRNIYINKNDLGNRFEITNIPKEILLYQAGYFTIRKLTTSMARLVIPNTEVEDSLLNLFLNANNIKISTENEIKIDRLVDLIDKKEIKQIIDTFNNILNDCVSNLSHIFEDERSVRDIIYAALPQDMNLQKIKEKETLKGRSDLELLTKKSHLVIEFERTRPDRDEEKSMNEAIEQIKSKKYGLVSFQNRNQYHLAMVISTEAKTILPEFCTEVFL